jgi:hypothetical protein
MKRHYGNYFKGIPHFKEFKSGLILANERQEVEQLLGEIKAQFLVS